MGEPHIGWLLGERAARGQPEERKYYWSNLPASATLEELVDVAHRRHAVEQFHEEAKGELGPVPGAVVAGFPPACVSAMLAPTAFCCGRSCDSDSTLLDGVAHATLFPPSARSASVHAASRASGGGEVAAPPSATVVDDYGSVHGTLLAPNLTK